MKNKVPFCQHHLSRAAVPPGPPRRPSARAFCAAALAGAMLLGGCSILRRDMIQPGTVSALPPIQTVIGHAPDGLAQFDVDAELIGRSPFLLYPMARESRERLPDRPVRNLHVTEGGPSLDRFNAN